MPEALRRSAGKTKQSAVKYTSSETQGRVVVNASTIVDRQSDGSCSSSDLSTPVSRTN